MNTVIEIEWTESERGWGQRPDGYSYHKDVEVARQYVKDYWSKMPDEVPDEYSRPDEPRAVNVDPIFALLVQGQGSIRTDKRHSV